MNRKEYQLLPEEVKAITHANVSIEGVPTKNTDEAWKKIGERLQINIRTAIVLTNEGLISAEPLSELLTPIGVKRSPAEINEEVKELNKLMAAEEKGASDPYGFTKEFLGAGRFFAGWLMGKTDVSLSQLYKDKISKPKQGDIIMPDKRIIM